MGKIIGEMVNSREGEGGMYRKEGKLESYERKILDFLFYGHSVLFVCPQTGDWLFFYSHKSLSIYYKNQEDKLFGQEDIFGNFKVFLVARENLN